MAVQEDRSKIATVKRGIVAQPALQPAVFVGLAFAFIWVVRPTGSDWLKIPFLVVVVLIPFASNFLHGDRLRDLGLRLDNLPDSLREVGIATAIGAGAILAIGVWAGVEPHFGRRALNSLLLYPGWGLVQQYAMQSFTYRRIKEGVRRPGLAAALTAALFAAVHYPNLALAGVTLVGGYVWCRLFDRHPNLFMLALSHGWLAVLLRASWPARWLHSLTIGPDFWHWSP